MCFAQKKKSHITHTLYSFVFLNPISTDRILDFPHTQTFLHPHSFHYSLLDVVFVVFSELHIYFPQILLQAYLKLNPTEIIFLETKTLSTTNSPDSCPWHLRSGIAGCNRRPAMPVR